MVWQVTRQVTASRHNKAPVRRLTFTIKSRNYIRLFNGLYRSHLKGLFVITYFLFLVIYFCVNVTTRFFNWQCMYNKNSIYMYKQSKNKSIIGFIKICEEITFGYGVEDYVIPNSIPLYSMVNWSWKVHNVKTRSIRKKCWMRKSIMYNYYPSPISQH